MKNEGEKRSTRSKLWILLLALLVLGVLLAPAGLSAADPVMYLDGFKDRNYVTDGTSAFFGGSFTPESGTEAVGTGATLYVYDDGTYYWMLWELEKSFVDNSYDGDADNGETKHPTWDNSDNPPSTKFNHTFDDLVESDHQRLQIYDACSPSAIVVDVAMDYIDGYSETLPLETTAYDTNSSYGVPDPPTISDEGLLDPDTVSAYYNFLGNDDDTSPDWATDWANFDYATSLWGNLNATDYCELPLPLSTPPYTTQGDCDNHGNGTTPATNDLIGSAGNIWTLNTAVPPVLVLAMDNDLAESPSWQFAVPTPPDDPDDLPYIPQNAAPTAMSLWYDWAIPNGWVTPTEGWEYAVMYEMRILKSVVDAQCNLGIDPANTVPVNLHASPNKGYGNDDILISNRDYGDLPDGYNTLEASDGPYHIVQLPDGTTAVPIDSTAIWLGAEVDIEGDGAPTTDATGDDVTPVAADEDGVEPVDIHLWDAGEAQSFDVTVSRASDSTTAGYIVIWIDWDNDGSSFFTDETIANGGVYVQEVTWTGSNLTEVVNIPITVGSEYNPASPSYSLNYRVRLFTSLEAAQAAAGGGASVEPAYVGGTVNGEVEDYSLTGTSLPVTISYFEATGNGENVRFEWQTASEAANVGFNIYVETKNGKKRINKDIIPSQVIDSTNPQDYLFEAAGVKGDTFYIEDVSIENEKSTHGPVKLGEAAGAQVTADPINWPAIRAEHERKEAKRGSQATEFVVTALEDGILQNAGKVGLEDTSGSGLAQAQVKIKKPINLIVDREGLYRVTYEDLKQAGFDLKSTNPDRLVLLNQGQSVPMRVEANWKFRQGSFIEFYGQGLDTTYTDENIYTLVVDRNSDRVLRIAEEDASGTGQPAAYYMETVLLGEQNVYNAQAPVIDPWYDTEFFVYKNTETWDFNVPVDNYVPGKEAATLSVGLWGRGNWAGVENNHHMKVVFNDEAIKELSFGGTTDVSFSKELGAATVKAEDNMLYITQIGDTGALWDFAYLDSYGLTYPRAFVAKDDGMLIFEAAADVFKVTDLPSDRVEVYRIVNGVPVRLTGVTVSGGAGNHSATFAGSAEEATYVVAAEGALQQPAIEAGRPHTNITNSRAEYLIISHEDFIDELDELVEARQKDYKVRVVNVDDVYAQFSHGIFDAEAIKDYLAYAVNNMGTTHVLLVGGDTYDYRDYTGKGSMSFIPSLYEQVGSFNDRMPVDPKYVDLDDDGVPDRAIGRFPVRSSAELAWMISKTLSYQANVAAADGYGEKAIFAAGNGFKIASDGFVEQLSGWDVERVYLNDMTLAEGHVKLIADIEEGAALTTFMGHSGSTVWSSNKFFTSSDAGALQNMEKPTVISQWGCLNTNYVDPAYNTMAHKFLVAGEMGAAAVTGASGYSLSSSEMMLGNLLTPKLVEPGMTIGDAMQRAKAEMENPEAHGNVLYGWTLLGDPGLMVQPQP